jgi:hypothetical protein
MYTYKTALGERFALIIRNGASEPFEYVATSLVEAKRTVVVNSVTCSTNQVDEPDGLVSLLGLESAILSPGVYPQKGS